MSTSAGATSARRKIFGLPVFVASSIFVTLVGILLFIVAEQGWLRGHQVIKVICEQVGGLLIATGVLSVMWEAFGKTAFTREVLGYAHVSRDIADAGIRRATMKYLADVEWDELFSTSRNLDIFVAYGRTWRHTHLDNLKKMARRSGTRIRVLLPDPDDALHLEVMARRFNRSLSSLESDVREALREFAALSNEPGASVEMYVREGDWLFSCYSFDDRSVLVLYSHAQLRQPVPTLVLTDGSFADFARGDITAIHAQSTGVALNLALQGKAR